MRASLDWFNPRRFLLISLGVDPAAAMQSKILIRAGEQFGMSANQLRVALSRLVADGLLDNPERGFYQLSPRGARLQAEIDGWRTLEQRRQAWQGGWCALLTENLASAGSTLWRHQLRVLSLRGMARWRPGLWVRPDNLVGGLPQLEQDLRQLGLDAIQGCFTIAEPDESATASLMALWDCDALNQRYADHEAQLRQAMAGIEQVEVSEALVQTLSLGSEVVRGLSKDPLLPGDMVDVARRRRVIEAMGAYDVMGKQLWQRFYQSLA